MLAHRLRQLTFGNWRNKGVALFFAVTIWFVAFRTEMQSDVAGATLALIPKEKDQVIILQEHADRLGKPVLFDRQVQLEVSGPRRQIEKLKNLTTPRGVQLPVEVGTQKARRRQVVVLPKEAFTFLPPGVALNKVTPDQITLTVDAVEEKEFPVEMIFQRIPEGMEADAPKADPATVKLHGPGSVLSEIRVVAEAWVSGVMDRHEETVALQLRHPETLDRAFIDAVKFAGPARAKVSARFHYKRDAFDADQIAVRFLIPSAKFPYRVRFEEENIAVRFQGPLAEIRGLREKVRSSDFFLGVLVPPQAGEAELTASFTEDGLLLYGFSERVQILQHPSRQAQGKGAWTYHLIPIAAPARPGGN